MALNPEHAGRVTLVERGLVGVVRRRLAVLAQGPGSRVGSPRNGRAEPDARPSLSRLTISWRERNLPIVDFIKMDIEGAELPALRGSVRTIREHQPDLAIAVYHPRHGSG